MTIFSKKYDLFISYKSEDVQTVRLIADNLIASGKKTWFAEYNILLIDRSRFQENIDQGIRDSKFGVAFTNKAYFNSKYCQLEMEQLIRYCGPKKIMNIIMAPELSVLDKYPELKDSPSIEYKNINETLNFIANQTGGQILSRDNILPIGTGDIFAGYAFNEPYTIDTNGWKMVEESFHGGGPCYLFEIDRFELFWNLQFGEELSPLIYDARRNASQRDERAFYNELCDYALHYYQDLQPGSRVYGVHLYNINGMSQFAVSYFDGSFWKRRYSLMLVHSDTYQAVEFLFTFQFSGPFYDYCRLVELMDKVVYSFDWGKSTNTKDSSVAKPSLADDKISGIIKDQPMANKFYDQALIFAKQGQLQEAVECWEKVLLYTILPEMRAAVQFNLGRAFEKMTNEQKAIEYYEESINTNPGQANALCNIGTIYLRNGNPEKALEYFLRAIKCTPDDQVTIRNLVACYTLLGNFAKRNQWQSKIIN